MFSGNYQHVLDEKNRVAIPSAIKEVIVEKRDGRGFYITRGLEGCLFMFPPRLYDEFVTNYIKKLPHNSLRRRLERAFSAPAFKTFCDPQGRVVIPQDLKEYAGLGRDVVLAGVPERIEIWDARKWKSLDEENIRDLDKLAEELHKAGP